MPSFPDQPYCTNAFGHENPKKEIISPSAMVLNVPEISQVRIEETLALDGQTRPYSETS